MPRKTTSNKLSVGKKLSGIQKQVVDKYDAPFYKVAPTSIFGLAGIFYLAVPHDVIVSLGLDLGESQVGQIVFGAVLVVFAVAFWLINHKKVK